MPTLFFEIFGSLLGLLLGSFANVLVLRDDRRASIVTGRSECPNCKQLLTWYELVPVISFLILRGRCRSCGKPISWQYPLVELVSSGLWLFATYYGFVLHGSLLAAVFLGLCLSALLVISVIDIRTQMVAAEYCIVAGLLGGFASLTLGVPVVSLVIGFLAGGGLLAVVLLGWKRLTGQDGMGEGDVWIAASLGLAAGWPLIGVALLFAVLLGSFIGVGYAVLSKQGFKIRIPFGPFLAIGFVGALAWGQMVLSWYILQLR